MVEFYIVVFCFILFSFFDFCWILFFNFNGKFELILNLNWWNVLKDWLGIFLNSFFGYKILMNCLRLLENLFFLWIMNFFCCMLVVFRKILFSVFLKFFIIWLCLVIVLLVIFFFVFLREFMEKIIYINKVVNIYLN